MQKDKKYVAFVCTGNTCRSPMAEIIFNGLAEEKMLNVRAESFGMAVPTGLGVSHNSITVCKEWGFDLSSKTTTAACDANLSKYSVFYCMSQSHAKMLVDFLGVPDTKITVLNISDPYGGNIDVYRECRNQIYNSILEIISRYENRENDKNSSE